MTMWRTESRIYFWSTLGAMVALSVAEGRFVVEPSPVSFDQALETCGQRAGSFLANIANMEEVREILEVVFRTLGPPPETQTLDLWIGLRKGRTDCVVQGEPLRGFKWTVDVASNPEVARWKKEPTQTCTTTRCALLSVELNQTDVLDWGLVSSSCQKDNHPFLCKQGEVPQGEVPQAGCPPTIDVPEARSQRTDQDGKLMVECSNGEIHRLDCNADTQTWTLGDGSAAGAGICPTLECGTGFARDEWGNCVDVDECENQPGLCRDICTNTMGSYLCQCQDQLGNIHDEGAPACSSESAAVTAPPVGVTDIDVTIQVATPTPKAPILGRASPSSPPASTEPPASSGADNSQVEVETPERTSILIPVAIAVMALVVLVVVVVAVVKCCLRRRSQQLAMKKAEKMAMKRSEAAKEDRINGQDSMERTNEKEAT